jgi:hypothetical protein
LLKPTPVFARIESAVTANWIKIMLSY